MVVVYKGGKPDVRATRAGIILGMRIVHGHVGKMNIDQAIDYIMEEATKLGIKDTITQATVAAAAIELAEQKGKKVE